MGLTEIIVLAVVALVMGGMGALVHYVNTPVKEGEAQDPKKK
jgi:Na+-transporting methylmalonyl-CoA/oxaloacetate decarboxylase gamma subunit